MSESIEYAVEYPAGITSVSNELAEAEEWSRWIVDARVVQRTVTVTDWTPYEPEPAATVPKCGQCGRERQLTDVNDYNPLQAVMGAPLGWYSGDDGELCPECITALHRKANQ